MDKRIDALLKVYRQRIKKQVYHGEDLLDDFLLFLQKNNIELSIKESSNGRT